MCICIAHSVLNPVGDAVGVRARGHKGQYWVTDRVNTINVRHGWVQSAHSFENRPALNAWNWLFGSLANYSITTNGQKFDPGVSYWVCKRWKINTYEKQALLLNSWFSHGSACTRYCTALTPISAHTVLTLTWLHCDARLLQIKGANNLMNLHISKFALFCSTFCLL